ncbi:hypothetical protein R3W88_005257 [Solanum pinnatisectum]|uniref:Uncharacterized protein n=1 Tax=Solanum pinnatisectum TaxID=50273 RepID=A0AAV9KBP9_9SOLN|nr:hypothetical protein R3W88_005257 [Solanum pinnatisectum]
MENLDTEQRQSLDTEPRLDTVDIEQRLDTEQLTLGECKCELLSNWGLRLIQRFRRDRRILLNFMLSGSLIKKVVMPPGAVSLDDVGLDQLVDLVLTFARKGRESTNPKLSGLPLRRLPPPVPIFTPSPILPTLSMSESIDTEPFEDLSNLSKSQSLSSTQQQELTMLLLILCFDCHHLLLVSMLIIGVYGGPVTFAIISVTISFWQY